MPKLYITNFNLEEKIHSLVFPQKQYTELKEQFSYLPLLYAEPEDQVLISDPINSSFINTLEKQAFWQKKLPQISTNIRCIDDFDEANIEMWSTFDPGYLAHKKRFPPLELLSEIHSKKYLFENHLTFPQSLLIDSLASLEKTLIHFPKPCVLKALISSAGCGNFIFTDHTISKKKAARLFFFFQQGCMLLEPWVDRVFDFSTQWQVTPDKKIIYLGATEILTSCQGRYQGSRVSCHSKLLSIYHDFFLEHQNTCYQQLKKIAYRGLWGYIGFDAMLYLNQDKKLMLHPIVEINARKTMGHIALKIKEKLASSQLTLETIKNENLQEFSFIPRFKENDCENPYTLGLKITCS